MFLRLAAAAVARLGNGCLVHQQSVGGQVQEQRTLPTGCKHQPLLEP